VALNTIALTLSPVNSKEGKFICFPLIDLKLKRRGLLMEYHSKTQSFQKHKYLYVEKCPDLFKVMDVSMINVIIIVSIKT
jgi:hypothetical protein